MLLAASGWNVFSKFAYFGFDLGLLGLLLISMVNLFILLIVKMPEEKKA